MRVGLNLEPGKQIGAFTLGTRLGGGGESQVWSATGDGLTVALKFIHDQSDPFARARLAREATALRRVRHESVIGLFQVGDRDGEAYLALELLDAGTFGDVLNEGLLAPDAACATLAPIAEALAVAHGAGVVHRDVKPSNILLAADGPRLIDFGAAALDGVVLDGWIDGAEGQLLTPRYAAPERAVGPALDVYSLGAVLSEAVFGAQIDGATMIDGSMPVDFAAPEHGAPGGDLYRAVWALVRRGCAEDPRLRPSMREFELALRSIAGAVAPCVAERVIDLVAAEVDPDQATPLHEDVLGSATAVRNGREFEIARLLDGFDAARASHELRTTLITAPPGMGKSWLIDAAAERGALQGGQVLRARCSEAVGDMRAIRTWVRDMFGMSSGSNMEDRQGDREIRSAIGAHHASVLLHAVGLARGETTAADTAEIAEAVAVMLRHAETPIAIIDDLHYASDEWLAVLTRLSFRSEISGVLWLGARPGTVDADELDAQSLRLGPLADAVIVDLAGAEAIELAGGNPLLAREISLALAQGAEVGTDVRAMIRSRIDRVARELSPSSWLAAACGDVFWPEMLGASDAVGVLCREGIVRVRVDSSILASTEAEWTHPVLREVAYERLTQEQQRAGHLGVAKALDNAEADVEVVAHHAGIAFEKGAEVAEFVAGSAARAARAALDRFALRNASRWIELLKSADVEPVAGTLDTLRAELAMHEGDYVSSANLTEAWIDLVDDLGIRALTVNAESQLAMGHPDVALIRGERAMGRLADSLRRDRVAGTVAMALARVGLIDEAIATCDDAANQSLHRGDTAFSARLLAQRAIHSMDRCMRIGADFISERDEAANALQTLRSIGDDRAFAEAAYDLADIVSTYDPGSVTEILVPAMAAAQRLHDAVLESKIANAAVQLGFDTGDIENIAKYIPLAKRGATDQRMQCEIATAELSFMLAMRGPEEDKLTALRAVAADSPAWVTAPNLSVVTANLWFGRVHSAKQMLNTAFEFPFHETMLRAAVNAVEGIDWSEPDAGEYEITIANELALLGYLRGDAIRADDLLLRRHAFLVESGSTYQRYNNLYSGALVSALGPPETNPNVGWLVEQISRPSMPFMWAIHRAICGVILVERGHPDASEICEMVRRIATEAKPDAPVKAWLLDRLV